MTLLGLRGDSMVLARARVPPSSDALRARREFERSLADADWRPPSLPIDAVLLVRRIAVPAHEPAEIPAPLGVRVGRELRRHASLARRPWLHADAATAEAVLFADEAELIACLARDCLCGRVADKWWWRHVLGGASPGQWLRGHVLHRGDIVVAVVAKLAVSGHASAWAARLEPEETQAALAAIQLAHGLRIGDDARDLTGMGVAEKPRRKDIAALEPTPAARGGAEIARLAVVVPEAFSPSLAVAQRRLLAVALGLARMPAWVRSRAFARAWHAIDAATTFARVAPPAASHAQATSPAHLAAVSRTRAQASSYTREERDRRSTESAPGSAHFDGIESLSQVPVEVAPAPARAESAARRCESRVDPVEAPAAKKIAAVAFAPRAEGTERSNFEAFDPVAPAMDVEPEPPDAAFVFPQEVAAPRIPTAFGALFYLLNAALGMGLYADFTAPRATGLDLSPWDWLALVGREWFGRDFVEDPVWRVLAELAGRAPEEGPDRDFRPPSDHWLDQHLALLHARLVQALDVPPDIDVRTFVCRHDAEIEVSATTVHVFLTLAHLDLAIRIAGLDRDTGWIPAAGRAVRFHFT